MSPSWGSWATRSWCTIPGSGAPARELAALGLKESRAKATVLLALHAVEPWPEDRHAWELQAACMLGDLGLDFRLASPVGGTVGIGAGVSGNTYAFQAEPREDRRRTEVGFGIGLTPRLRTSTSVALDRWEALGMCTYLGVDFLLMRWDDRASLRVAGGGWRGPSDFAKGSAELRLVSSERQTGPILYGRVEVLLCDPRRPLRNRPGGGDHGQRVRIPGRTGKEASPPTRLSASPGSGILTH